jgi:hypothetical protein
MKTRPLLALASLALLPACGHKGDPLAPLRRTPPAPVDFRFSQRGDQLELEASAPGASIDGVVYAERVALEFLYGSGPIDLEKRGQRREAAGLPGQKALVTLPLPAPGTLVRASSRAEYSGQRGARSLTKALVVQAPLEPPRELQAVADEAGVHLSWQGVSPKAVEPPPLPGVPGSPFLPTTGRPGSTVPVGAAPGVTNLAPGGAPPAGGPPPSNPVGAASPGAPPAPATSPAAVAAAPAAAAAAKPGETTAPTAATAAAKPGVTGAPAAAQTVVPRRNGFFVYRRVGNGPFSRPLDPEPAERGNVVDAGAPMGERVCYVIRAVASTDPLIESAASNEACVERRDTTPPETPAGLALLPRGEGLEVLWSPSAEADLAGYRVYREAAGEPRKRLAELSPEKAAYLDETAEKGIAYRYAVTAFDLAGNESEPTDPVEGSLP